MPKNSHYLVLSTYKVRYRNSEDGSKTEEIVVTPGVEDDTSNVSFRLPGLAVKDVYKINIFSVVEDASGAVIESKALHEKIVLQSDGALSIYKEEEKE